MPDAFGFQVFLDREMSDSNSRYRLFFVAVLSRVIRIKADRNETTTYVANTVGILQPTFRIQSYRIMDFDSDAFDKLWHR